MAREFRAGHWMVQVSKNWSKCSVPGFDAGRSEGASLTSRSSAGGRKSSTTALVRSSVGGGGYAAAGMQFGGGLIQWPLEAGGLPDAELADSDYRGAGGFDFVFVVGKAM
ncbi:hypothetical protein NN3_00980 [Nocardia neocaledoniensis NBRC 108232]|uniref:Uncharacterized protein n=1 Tax=Nocardia neocaledoniensis TaxID=236511 RepID=A0A317NID1_9NOCA|nr:hypothetical protein [Nocardia neocaledoniensis]PWV74414.1 hypothetical protein DFR69_106225 [Nocardia neocaledoniensis]GEM29091.1 hypothetical protein NN3_00980 [Nocardia neocaledoniensis NBRC 108232]